ncbi:MAG: DUF6265 family protein [Pseudomonadales bacterium]
MSKSFRTGQGWVNLPYPAGVPLDTQVNRENPETHLMHYLSRTVAALSLCFSVFAHAGTPTVNDLAWMTGYWRGPVGEATMEENWNAPLGGTMSSAVRMAGAASTQMLEMVIIREQDGTLVLALQQFNPDYTPRTPAPQTMTLASLGERTVSFAPADGSPGLQRLTYSRSADDVFTVEAQLPDGSVFRAPLSPH